MVDAGGVLYSTSMPRDDDKLVRQLSLVSFLLTQRRPVTARHVHDCVEGYAAMSDTTFVRRFYDDRADLLQGGIRVEAAEDDDGESYFLPDENYRLPDLELEEEELRALAVALVLLEGRFAYARPLRLALVNLTHGHPDPSSEETERVAVSLEPDEEARTSGQALARLDDAIARGKTVRFNYRTSTSDLIQERTLDPYSLFRTGGHWYAAGRDHDRGAVRTFRLSRVSGAVRFSTKRPRDFSPPPDLDLTEFRLRPPWQLGDIAGEATIRVDDELAWWVTRTYPDVETLPEVDAEKDADHVASTVFRTTYADADALITWVLGMGRRAELLEPTHLREAVVHKLQRVREAHV